MTAVLKKEFKGFFTGPIGYCVLAVLVCLSGYFFFLSNLSTGSSDMTSVFNSLYLVILLILPILTMRTFSDEKRQKTDQALLTAPVSLTGVVLGKFFAALLVFMIGMMVTVLYAVVIAVMVTPAWMTIIGSFIGTLLLGGTVIALGLLISSLTESQFIAALGTIALTLLWMLIGSLSSVFASSTVITAVTEFLALDSRYYNFVMGTIHYSDILFFLSMQAIFLFLTIRVLDRKRWN